jgi:hypothetical protein
MSELIEITEVFDYVVCEMSSEPGGMVPLLPDVVARITDGDDDPKFATFVIESGWSKSKRFWGPELFADVASEINAAAQGESIVGYMGHIRPEDDPYLFPEIQLQWAGAKLLQQSGEKARLAVKAYVLPGTKGKDYLKRGLVKTVSWRGKIAQELYQQGVRVKKFAIESIDLSRPRAAGMSARLVGALTSEMENGEEDQVKPEEIAALQANELRAHNPGLVKNIVDEAREPLDTKIGEMTTAADAVKPTLDLIPELRKLLHLDDNAEPLAVITATITHLREAGKSLRDSVLDSVLSKKLKGGDEKDRNLVRTVIAGEMRDREITLSGDKTKDEKAVEEMVNEIVNSNDDLKATVSEMEDAPPTPPETSGSRRGKSRELKAGDRTANLRVRSAL